MFFLKTQVGNKPRILYVKTLCGSLNIYTCRFRFKQNKKTKKEKR